MKALCIAELNGDYTFQPQDDKPEVGKYYLLEDAISGTLAQNKLFHALVTEYWKSGMHPTLGGEPYDELRNWIKDRLGQGKESYKWLYIGDDMKLTQGDCKKYEDIPPQAIEGLKDGTGYAFGKLKSWSDYTKKQRMKCIDNLIAEMTAAGVNSKKFMEILNGQRTI